MKKLTEDQHYVYIHKNGDEIVYIGSGAEGRAFSASGRKGLHYHWMCSYLMRGDTSFVEFYATRLSKKESLELEAGMIREIQPRFNKFFTDAWKENNKARGLKGAEVTRKACVTPLGRFESVSAACSAHGFNCPSSVSYRIKNKFEGFHYE